MIHFLEKDIIIGDIIVLSRARSVYRNGAHETVYYIHVVEVTKPENGFSYVKAVRYIEGIKRWRSTTMNSSTLKDVGADAWKFGTLREALPVVKRLITLREV